jgi:D-sedoheptulose 7-phosphate isomerase
MLLEMIVTELEDVSKRFLDLKAQALEIQSVVVCCCEAVQKGGKILFCGNGGSAADAQHLAAELVGRYKRNRPALAAVALTVDTSILTAVANDFGHDQVFARQIEALGKKDDVLYAISTSGKSVSILNAMKQARQIGMKVVALTGGTGGDMWQYADITLCVPADTANRIQELHIAIGHLICDGIESVV